MSQIGITVERIRPFQIFIGIVGTVTSQLFGVDFTKLNYCTFIKFFHNSILEELRKMKSKHISIYRPKDVEAIKKRMTSTPEIFTYPTYFEDWAWNMGEDGSESMYLDGLYQSLQEELWRDYQYNYICKMINVGKNLTLFANSLSTDEYNVNELLDNKDVMSTNAIYQFSKSDGGMTEAGCEGDNRGLSAKFIPNASKVKEGYYTLSDSDKKFLISDYYCSEC